MLTELIGALPSIFGALTGGSARRDAERAAMETINEFQRSYDDEVNRQKEAANTSLSSAAGVGNDALGVYSRSLGDNLASAGVYNSSATAGAITNQSNVLQGLLAKMAMEKENSIAQYKNQGKTSVAGMKMGLARDNVANARADENDMIGGLSGLFGGLQQLLGKPKKKAAKTPATENADAQHQFGVNNLQFGLPPINGQTGKAKGLTVPGAAPPSWRDTMNLATPYRSPYALNGEREFPRAFNGG